MKSIQKLRIEDSMAGLFINVMAFSEAVAGKRISTGRRVGKAILALYKPSFIMKQKSPNRISHSGDPKHNLATVLSTSPKGSGLTKSIDRSSGMLTNTVCRN